MSNSERKRDTSIEQQKQEMRQSTTIDVREKRCFTSMQHCLPLFHASSCTQANDNPFYDNGRPPMSFIHGGEKLFTMLLQDALDNMLPLTA